MNKKLIRLQAAFLLNVGSVGLCKCQVLWEVCLKHSGAETSETPSFLHAVPHSFYLQEDKAIAIGLTCAAVMDEGLQSWYRQILARSTAMRC